MNRIKGIFRTSPPPPPGLTGQPDNIRKELRNTANSNAAMPFGPPPRIPNSPVVNRAAENNAKARRAAFAAFAPSRAVAAKVAADEAILDKVYTAGLLEEGRSPSPPPMGGSRHKAKGRKTKTKSR